MLLRHINLILLVFNCIFHILDSPGGIPQLLVLALQLLQQSLVLLRRVPGFLISGNRQRVRQSRAGCADLLLQAVKALPGRTHLQQPAFPLRLRLLQRPVRLGRHLQRLVQIHRRGHLRPFLLQLLQTGVTVINLQLCGAGLLGQRLYFFLQRLDLPLPIGPACGGAHIAGWPLRTAVSPDQAAAEASVRQKGGLSLQVAL